MFSEHVLKKIVSDPAYPRADLYSALCTVSGGIPFERIGFFKDTQESLVNQVVAITCIHNPHLAGNSVQVSTMVVVKLLPGHPCRRRICVPLRHQGEQNCIRGRPDCSGITGTVWRFHMPPSVLS